MPVLRLLAVLAVVITLGAPPVAADLLTRADQDAYRAAFAAARANDWPAARDAARRGRDALLGKALQWLELTRSTTAEFSDIVEFLERNPDWPLAGVLRERAELAAANVPDALLLPYFRQHEPTTPRGQLRFAEMLEAAGEAQHATALARAVWLRSDLDAEDEAEWLAHFAAVLRPEDHAVRLDRLLWEGAVAAARRQLARVAAPQRLLGEARLALSAGDAAAESALARVPPELREDPGLRLDEARWRRRHDQLDLAAHILLNPSHELGRAAAWLSERQVLARRLIDASEPRAALVLVQETAPAGGKAAHPDAAMLAGWIALRRLGDPDAARGQFVAAGAASSSPGERARSAYWAGRAAEALADKAGARAALAGAAAHPTTFYGQLAATRIGLAPEPRFPPEPRPAAELVASFEASEPVEVARRLGEIGEATLAKPFLLSLSARAKTPEQQMLVLALAETLGRREVALIAARRAGADGVPLLAAGYPLLPLPRVGTVEDPLVLALTRQESGFDTLAVSRNDARGLMQLLPSTAKGLAKSLGMSFSGERLLTDPDYNLALGRAYLGQMLDKFAGSYVLAVAAYNAGPARVGQWLEAHGDPRGQSLDAVLDWIELIPFAETRNYVQRVLENLEIYRLRLGDPRAFTLADDLRR